MPPVRSVGQLLGGASQPDGFQVVCSNLPTINLRLADVPVGQRVSAVQAEAFINARLVTLLAGQFQVVVHVFSVVPLNLTVCCANSGVTISPNWWILP